MDNWSTVSAGLQQHSQQQTQFIRLANSTDTVALQILSQALEPAQYYTRQHLKFQAGNYHQFEPLNRYADALSAESMTVRQINKWAERLVSDAEDNESAESLRHVFNRWQNNTSDALALSESNYQLKALKPVILEVDKLASIGLRLTDLVARQGTLDDAEIASIQRELDSAAQIQDEVVIAVVYPLEKLLRATRN
jgi:hexosaminidase